MTKKVRRVKYELDAQGIKGLPMSEIKIILRGADELIMSGGRAMLAKILAGSKDKKLIQLELDDCPVYGALNGEIQKEILAKIDWMILNDYLAIEYDYKIPLLVFTDKGWNIERETFAEELLDNLIQAAEGLHYEYVETLKDRDRGMILLLLDKIAESENKELVDILRVWKSIDYKKVQARIQEVIEVLEGLPDKPAPKETISFYANKMWLAIPADIRAKLERNVFCSSCLDAVQIVQYSVKELRNGIVLEGKCKTCGQQVARVID